MKNFTICLFLLAAVPLLAQVGVNTTTPNAMLDVDSPNTGLLIPRVALTANNVAAPIVNPQGGALAVSTLVYNTATTGGANAVSPGYYYWNGAQWVTFTGRDWNVSGNVAISNPAVPVTYGTTTIAATENFMGTTDANDIVFGTNFLERMRVKQGTGFVGIGTATPAAKLDIVAPGNGIGMRILSGNAGQLTYLSLGRTVEHAQIGSTTTGTFFTDALPGDMAVKNFDAGKLLLGASYFAPSAMSIANTGNIGVNTYTANSKLDINGDLALREGTAISVTAGANALVPTGEFSHYRLTGAAGAFSISSIANGNNGQMLTLINATGQPMTVINNNVANGILTGTGTNIVSTSTNNTSVTLLYNASLARWVVTSNSGLASNEWHTTGNAGTNDPNVPATYGTSAIAAAENWAGTSDANDFVVGTNAIERLRVKQTTGFVGIGTAAPTEMLHVFRNSMSDKYNVFSAALQPATGADFYNIGVRGFGSGIGAYGFGIGTMGIGDPTASWYATGVLSQLGVAATIPASEQALFSNGNNLGYSGIFWGGNLGVGTQTPTRALFQAQGAVGNTVAAFNLNNNSQGIAVVSDWPGLYFNSYFNGGTRQMSSTGYPSMINYDPSGQFQLTFGNTANTLAGNLAGGTFYNRLLVHRDLGAGFHYSNAAITGLTVSSGGLYPDLGWFSTTHVADINAGQGVAASGQNVGVLGRANHFSTSTVDKLGGVFYVSGYNGGPSWGIPAAATVGSVVDNTVFKVFGFGVVSTIVKDTEENDRVMVAPESPEALFQDYGTAQLVNGYAKIALDPILSKNIRVDKTHPLKVFVQLEGDCNGVYVFNKTATSFEVKELQNGTANVPFSYQIVATRADEERAGVVSKYSEMRFKPTGVRFSELPKPDYATEFRPKMAEKVDEKLRTSETEKR